MFKEAIKKMWTPTTKRYVISTLVTFFSGFFLSIGANIESLDAGTIGAGVVIGIIFAAIRAGLKCVTESYIFKRTPIKD